MYGNFLYIPGRERKDSCSEDKLFVREEVGLKVK